MKEFVSWELIDDCVTDIAFHLEDTGKDFKGVFGVPRGGSLLAVMLSHKLDIPYINTINKNTLVIDDICDTGKTLNESPGWMYAVLHYKPTANFTPLCWGKEIGEEWIVYPWEREDSDTIQDYLK